jgi:hypothetical protein
MNKLEICKSTRKIAADSLYTVLKKLLQSKNPISEVMLRDAWLEEMRKNNNIFPDGWYTPPPFGVSILFANDENVERVNYKNIRVEEKWPRDDIYLNIKTGLAYFFASPVDKEMGIIGDFGVTLYFGESPEIKNLLKLCYSLDQKIFDYAQIGMKFSDITAFAKKLFEKYRLSNEIVSITDKAKVNIGHTIPASYESWNKKEKSLLHQGESNWVKVKDMISKKRVFVNDSETFIIKPGMAITIEPRPKIINKSYLPSSLSYHTIAFFRENGTKELLADFEELFTLAGMDYMIKQ